MRLRWYLLCAHIGIFFTRYKRAMNRLYWSCVSVICITLIAIPLTMAIRSPHVRLPHIHGVSPEVNMLILEWNRVATQYRREASRLGGFTTLVNNMMANYPFFDIFVERTGLDYLEIAIGLHEELTETARYNPAPDFFANFARERFIDMFEGLGDVRIAGEIRGTIPWVSEPYFMGHYDWRFYDDRYEIEVLEGNITTDTFAEEGIAYLRINHFLPKGYEPISRNPYWRFDFEADEAFLTDFFEGLYEYEHLVIDIRGINAGFGDYFLPLVLEPLVNEVVRNRFYAFQMEGGFARRVSEAFRTWYGFNPQLMRSDLLTQEFTHEIPEVLTEGFPIVITARPAEEAGFTFTGQIWLLTDSNNFVGPNPMYLQTARDAGFTIIYEETPQPQGWETSFMRLNYGGLVLRLNPLYFTNDEGSPFEKMGAFYDYRLDGEWMDIIKKG